MTTSNELPPGQQARYDYKQETIPVRRHRISHLEMYEVTAQDLRSIERESVDVGEDFAFASNTASVAITLLISMIFTTPNSPRVFAVCAAAMTALAVLSGYFFIRYFRKRGATRSTIQEIRERQTGPLGEEGHEISLSELAEEPSEPENPDRSDTAGKNP